MTQAEVVGRRMVLKLRRCGLHRLADDLACFLGEDQLLLRYGRGRVLLGPGSDAVGNYERKHGRKEDRN